MNGGNGHRVDGGHGDGRGHGQPRLQRIFCVANEEGARETGVGSKWDTFSALLRPPGSTYISFKELPDMMSASEGGKGGQ